MKKIILSTAILFVAFTSFAQNEKYIGAMKANIAAIDTSFRNPSNLITLSNTFELIAKAEKNQWLPYYYAAFVQVNYAFVNADKSKTDLIADKAASLISKADSLSPGNSEISIIKSMIATSRLLVDPMTRYQEFGALGETEIDNAIAQDTSNPRPYYLRGQNLKYTPEKYGGGCKNALPYLENSESRYAVFKPASELHPNWGKERNQMVLKECKK